MWWRVHTRHFAFSPRPSLEGNSGRRRQYLPVYQKRTARGNHALGLTHARYPRKGGWNSGFHPSPRGEGRPHPAHSPARVEWVRGYIVPYFDPSAISMDGYQLYRTVPKALECGSSSYRLGVWARHVGGMDQRRKAVAAATARIMKGCPCWVRLNSCEVESSLIQGGNTP